ncbi:hypothetical protein GGI07_003099 [Coemansia sp. Benny D115]|nr:hypothetical protein GGI07_003099 [Coemansia sp. Benny D115]
MSEYSAWNQLFRLNPDSPHTPMLSNQELQDELALWSNAQFQLEPVNDEPLPHKKPSTSPSVGSEEYQHGSLPTSASTQQPLSWDFMMGSSTADLLNAIASGSQQAVQTKQQQQQQWASLVQPQHHQVPQPAGAATATPVIINGVPMIPLVPMSQHQQSLSLAAPITHTSTAASSSSSSSIIAPSSHSSGSALPKAPLLAPAPAPAPASSSLSQYRHSTIVPKSSGVVLGSPLTETFAAIAPTPAAASSSTSSFSTTAQQSLGQSHTQTQTQTPAQSRRSSKSRQSIPVAEGIDVPSDDEDETGALQQQLGDTEGRLRAAEEDKRRRNTAASARFRVKKKLKEQALERTARDMTAKAEALEKRVHELETETRWLKSLITEKDPGALRNVHCPCHHPNGLDVSANAAAQQQQQQQAVAHRGTHLSIAPTPAGLVSAQQQQVAAVYKKPRLQ